MTLTHERIRKQIMTDDIPVTLTERIRADRITITSAKRHLRPPQGIRDWDADWWDITLSRPGTQHLRLPFGMGKGHDGRVPDAREVLSCLTADAAGLDNARGYSDWAADYGDGDKGYSSWLYKTVISQTAKLRRFLGEQYQ